MLTTLYTENVNSILRRSKRVAEANPATSIRCVSKAITSSSFLLNVGGTALGCTTHRSQCVSAAAHVFLSLTSKLEQEQLAKCV
jgi:hypothetical protein